MTDVVLLDFDGTITSKDTTKILLKELIILRPLRVFSLVWFVLNMLRSNNSVIQQHYKNKAIGHLIAGISESQLKSALHIFSGKVEKLHRPLLLKKIKEAHQNGASVLIVSASPSFAVSKCVADLPVTVIATEFKKSGNFYCGQLNGQNCYGGEKVSRIELWSQEQKLNCSYTEAWSDHFSDYSMLRLAKQRYWIGGPVLRKIVSEKDPDGNFVLINK